jgi:hypothetical protein
MFEVMGQMVLENSTKPGNQTAEHKKGEMAMSKPIYEIFVSNHNIAGNLAWNALTESERKALSDQERAASEAVGAKTLVLCDSAWADEMHPWWGCNRFPDLAARIEQTRRLNQAGWLDRMDAFSLLGTSETEMQAVTLPQPVYKLWIIKNNPATALTRSQVTGLQAVIREKHDAINAKHGGLNILYCDSSWCNEAYSGFGISAYPDVEANMKIMAELNELGWPGFFEAISYLGVPAR